MSEPTRKTITLTAPDGGAPITVTEWASLNSVELVNSVKDGWRVASVKVYDSDEVAAAVRAVAAARRAEELLATMAQTVSVQSAPTSLSTDSIADLRKVEAAELEAEYLKLE